MQLSSITGTFNAFRSSDEHGLCYIDTQNLDGEANLKQREVPRGYVEGVNKVFFFVKIKSTE